MRSPTRILAPVLALAVAGACERSGAPSTTIALEGPRAQLAPDDEPPPVYGKAEIQKALIAERAAEATLERELAELEHSDVRERLSEVIADLAVRRRAITILEHCEAAGKGCPPRLEVPPWRHAIDAETDPALEVPLRFDLDGWRQVAGELHWRACGCRSAQCIGSVNEIIARLEARPMGDVLADDTAMSSVVRARECLMRLAGKRASAHRAAN